MSGHIVVGIDGSDASKLALRWAARLAADLDARLVAATAWHYPLATGWSYFGPPYDPQADAEKMLHAALDEVFGDTRPSDLTLVIEAGHPTTMLLEHSREASMLVVGSRGLGGFAGLLLGSVSRSCAEHASCPVLVVHGEGTL